MKLFIHGVPDTAYMWTPLIGALGLGETDHIAPTMPGFGEPAPDGFSSTKEAYLGWVIETLEATANRHGPVDLVGHDWGAPLSAMAAQARPDLIRTWTVVNAAPEPTYRWHSMARLWQTPALGEIFMAVGTTKMLHRSVVQAGMPAPIADHEAPRFNRHMKRAILKLYRSAKKPAEWFGEFSNIADRGLVLWGADDPYVTIDVARRFSERWSLPLEVVEGAGHWGICQKPEEFARRLQRHWTAHA